MKPDQKCTELADYFMDEGITQASVMPAMAYVSVRLPPIPSVKRTTSRPNTPVPDELAATRAKIKRLQAHEEELKALLIANPDLREGAAWLAEIKVVKQQRTDLKELRAEYPDAVDQFTYPVEITRVVLSGIMEDGEIVSARRLQPAAAETKDA